MASEATRRDLTERWRSVNAARALDTKEYCRSLAAVEAKLEGERAHHVHAEADQVKQEASCQAMEKALDGNFPCLPSF